MDNPIKFRLLGRRSGFMTTRTENPLVLPPQPRRPREGEMNAISCNDSLNTN